MIRHIKSWAIVLGWSVALTSAIAQSGSGQTDDLGRGGEERLLAAEGDYEGEWQIAWDDAIDGQLIENPKTCVIWLESDEDRLRGEFVGEVQGRMRNARFSGKVYSGAAPLIQLTQQEADYVCLYQIYWSPGPDRTPTGVWHDSRGGSGEFSLLKMQ